MPAAREERGWWRTHHPRPQQRTLTGNGANPATAFPDSASPVVSHRNLTKITWWSHGAGGWCSCGLVLGSSLRPMSLGAQLPFLPGVYQGWGSLHIGIPSLYLGLNELISILLSCPAKNCFLSFPYHDFFFFCCPVGECRWEITVVSPVSSAPGGGVASRCFLRAPFVAVPPPLQALSSTKRLRLPGEVPAAGSGQDCPQEPLQEAGENAAQPRVAAAGGGSCTAHLVPLGWAIAGSVRCSADGSFYPPKPLLGGTGIPAAQLCPAVPPGRRAAGQRMRAPAGCPATFPAVSSPAWSAQTKCCKGAKLNSPRLSLC